MSLPDGDRIRERDGRLSRPVRVSTDGADDFANAVLEGAGRRVRSRLEGSEERPMRAGHRFRHSFFLVR